jgi:hypothetical protein
MRRQIIVLLFLTGNFLFAQTDTTGKVRYTHNYIFKDGIYLTFDEFKNNAPSITDFTIVKSGQLSSSNDVILEYPCRDSVSKGKKCEMEDCWGYCNKGTVYISHKSTGLYFKVMVVGAVCHFVALSGFDQSQQMNSTFTQYGAGNDYVQYFLDFDSGIATPFTYKKFVAFLKVKDTDLYKNLSIIKKNRRKLIFLFLLKYNEKHPIYFPR